MPLLETKGAGSAQGFGLTLQQATPVYIEDVFSTWLYTGNGSTQTITNGIDLSGKGGLVWIKQRSSSISHQLTDTARGTDYQLSSNLTDAQVNVTTRVTAFNANGFNIGTSSAVNGNGITFASWTFRKQAKFFDVVTWTGDGSATRRNISHNLGSVPGCIIVKRTDSIGTWWVYHRANSYGSEYSFELNDTPAGTAYVGLCDVAPTSTTFPVNSVGGTQYVNINGATYVAYLFAHNAGGFGLTGTDNVITCGSYTGNSSSDGPVINLGYEPQWVMIKRNESSFARGWYMFDNMRGVPTGSADAVLLANTSAAETTADGELVTFNATGFQVHGGVPSVNYSDSYIYIAIRRGPMKTPTTGTSVFSPQAVNGSTAFTTNFPVDLAMFGIKAGSVDNFMTFDRQRGSLAYLKTTSTAAEGTTTSTYGTVFDNNTGSNYKWWSNTSALAGWNFQRAPGFFDVVCYTGNDVSARAVNHNLGVAPELVIVKARNDAANWPVYASALGNNKTLYLNLTNASATSGIWGNTTATSSYFYVGVAGDYGINNATGLNYVAYLFASCPGVSKVGSYTGTGALQTINCGFTGGARFVLIKRTDSTGDWFVYDSARGITSGNDPYLLMNSTAAEVTGTNYVDTTSVGFQVTAAAPAGLNASGGTYLFLAVA